MTGFLLDTHIWIWYLAGSGRLSRGLRQLVDRESSHCWLSPVSIWETGLLASRGRIALPRSLREWIEEAIEHFPINEAPVNREVALVSQEIELPHQDPADHLIAATALVYDLVLVTVDERLIRAKKLPIRSK